MEQRGCVLLQLAIQKNNAAVSSSFSQFHSELAVNCEKN